MTVKRTLTILAILMVTMTSWAVDAVQPTTGEGTSGSPYEIASAGNLVWFAQQVNGGSTSICGKLTADIDLGDDQTMIGNYNNNFSGTFDGDGHTVTINYKMNNPSGYTALFRYIYNATIKNLRTSGSINSNGYIASIAAYCRYSTVINCTSNVSLTYKAQTTSEYCEIGGLLGFCTHVNVENCVFNGSINGSDIQRVGGILCYSSGSTVVTNCLYAPTSQAGGRVGSSTIGETGKYSDLSVTNCYCSSRLGGSWDGLKDVSGEQVSNGEVCFILNNSVTDGSQLWYQNLNNGKPVDTAPVPFKGHGTVYCDENICPSTLTCSNLHHVNSQDVTDICSQCNSVIPQCPEQDASGNYIINNRSNFEWFAVKVYAGKTSICCKLNADLNLAPNQAMIGTSSNKYSGTFDGGGHTVTVNYQTTEPITALFRYVGTATINNLTVAGTVRTSAKQAAGLVGMAESITLDKVISDVDIVSTYKGDSSFGGIVADASSSANITHCAFKGSIDAPDSYSCGGLLGWAENGVQAVIRNCYVDASFNVNSSGCMTFSRYHATIGTPPTITNSYYVTALGDAQGTKIDSDTSADGELCYKLNGSSSSGTLVWYQTIGTDAYPVFDSTHGTVYGGTDACPDTLAYSNVAHNLVDGYDSNGFGAKICSNDGCNYNILYTETTYEPAAYSNDTYTIKNAGNVMWIANKVNTTGETMNCKLANDIDMSCITNYTPIGLKAYPFKGSFDGQGYSIKKLTLQLAQGYLGFFGCVAGESTVIKNIIIDSSCSVKSTSGLGVAGLIGAVEANAGAVCNVTIENCGNDADVTGVENVASILGAVLTDNAAVVNINNCYNTGNIRGQKFSASIVGYARVHTSIRNTWNSGIIEGTNYNYTFGGTWEGIDANNNRGKYDGKIENCYTIDTEYNVKETSKTGVKTISEATYYSGALCYKLNGSTNKWKKWCQDLAKYKKPVFSQGESYGVHYTRTMKNQWGTICLPYAIENGDDYDLYTLTGISETEVKVKKVDGTLAAGTPVLIRCNTGVTDIDILPTTQNQDCVTEPVGGTAFNNLTLKGEFSKISLFALPGYIFANNSFWSTIYLYTKFEKTIYCDAFHAWIKDSQYDDDAKQLTIGGFDTPTAVGEVPGSLSTEEGWGESSIYDLGGHKLYDLQPGVNIIRFSNGKTKKVILK